MASEIEHLIDLLFLEAIRRVGLEEDKGSPKRLLRLEKKSREEEEEEYFGSVVDENNREFCEVSASFSIFPHSLTFSVKCVEVTQKREKDEGLGERSV